MSKIQDQLRATGVAQVIVVLDDDAGGTAAAARSDRYQMVRRHFSTDGSDQHSAIVDDGFVDAVLQSRRRPRALAASSVPRSSAPPQPVQFFKNLGVAYGVVSREGLAALKSDERVKSVSGAPQLSLVRPLTTKAAPSSIAKVGWGIRAMKVPTLWKDGLTGEGVLVAHLDTGIDGNHEVFDNGAAISSFVEIDRLGRRVTAAAPHDSGDHGTHTAATIAGRPDSRGRGVGVAPKATLAGALVIEGGDSVARVLSGLDWAVGQGAKVLSMSLGFRGYVGDFEAIVKILRQRGMLPVIATGNEGPQTSRSPGNYIEALSVGWSTKENEVDPDSSSQEFRTGKGYTVPDLVGPGGDIVSAKPGGGYQLMSGTSMATPHIAGLAALLWEAEPSATIEQIEAAILNSCAPLTGVSTARQGRGFPDGAKALELLHNEV